MPGLHPPAELAMVPWSEEQKREFVEMQFNAQDTFPKSKTRASTG